MYKFPRGNLFYRKLTKALPKIVRGDGVFLYDHLGKRYLDGSGGAIVVNIGHGVPEIADAIYKQAKEIAYVNGTQFTNEAAEELAKEITDVLPETLNKVYFLTSGAEATEAAIKLARQYWVEKEYEWKYRVISQNPGYHGSTLGALTISGRAMAKRFYHPLLQEFPMIPAPICYRCPYDDSHPKCGMKCAKELERVIQRQGAETVSAFIAEPIIGGSGGAAVPPSEYFQVVRDICDRHQILFIADEILTGMGRAGAWLAMDHYGIVPDIVLMGKGLGGGVAPLSGVVTKDDIVKTIADGSGAFVHGLTFAHTPVICAAGLATIRYIKKHGLVKRSADMGAYLLEQLSTLYDMPFVGDIRGKGLLAGIEFVEDRESKMPFPRDLRIADRIYDTALEKGLVIWPASGHVDGERGDLVMVGPPFCITEEQIDEIVRLMKMTLETVFHTIQEVA
jgi:adenosylmethionine-8-amino-7-oxononanoate aminotransferase